MLPNLDEDDSFFADICRSARNFILYSPVGRFVIEVFQIVFAVAVAYMLVCSIGEFIIFCLDLAKTLLSDQRYR